VAIVRLVGLPDDAEVSSGGLYKGREELDLQLGESGHTTTEVDVVVGRVPRPVILVLSAYDPVVWKVGYTARRVPEVLRLRLSHAGLDRHPTRHASSGPVERANPGM